jgi:hypothetical protein
MVSFHGTDNQNLSRVIAIVICLSKILILYWFSKASCELQASTHVGWQRLSRPVRTALRQPQSWTATSRCKLSKWLHNWNYSVNIIGSAGLFRTNQNRHSLWSEVPDPPGDLAWICTLQYYPPPRFKAPFCHCLLPHLTPLKSRNWVFTAFSFNFEAIRIFFSTL